MKTNLILWACVIWLPVLMYLLLKNETKFKKNIAVGITIPQEGRTDSEVIAALHQFQQQLRLVCVGLLLVALPCIFIPKLGVAMTVYMLWLDCCIVLPYLPYIRCNQKLRQIKRARGWQQNDSTQQTTVDLTAAAHSCHWLSPWLFLLPLLLALLPLYFDREQALVYSIDAASVLFCWLGYRYLYRNRAEIVDANTAINATLTRIRRYNWGKCWLICAWFLALLNLLLWLGQNQFGLTIAGTLLLTFGITAAVISVEFRTRAMQEKLTANSGIDFYVDEDDKWMWGIFYYNPYDRRLLMNQRVGMNTTLNLAKPAGKAFLAATALLLLALPLLGVWMDWLETTPVALQITDTTVIAAHTGTAYEIPLDAITQVNVIDTLPAIRRIAGTGMDTVQKGNYKTPWGSARVCLDPRTAPYLQISTMDGKQYLFGSSDSAETKHVAEILAKHFELNNSDKTRTTTACTN